MVLPVMYTVMEWWVGVICESNICHNRVILETFTGLLAYSYDCDGEKLVYTSNIV